MDVDFQTPSSNLTYGFSPPLGERKGIREWKDNKAAAAITTITTVITATKTTEEILDQNVGRPLYNHQTRELPYICRAANNKIEETSLGILRYGEDST